MQDLEKIYKEIESADIEKLEVIQGQMLSRMLKELAKVTQRQPRVEKQKKLS